MKALAFCLLAYVGPPEPSASDAPVSADEGAPPETAEKRGPPEAEPVSIAPVESFERDLHWRPVLDLSLLIGGAAVYGTTSALSDRINPEPCRWCDPELNGFDAAFRRVRWQRPEAAATTSDIVAYGVIPLGMLGLNLAAWHEQDAWSVWWQDIIYVWEAVAVSAAVTQGVKLAAARRRPYARFGDPLTLEPFSEDSDQNMSFWSGHTGLAFSVVTATGTVATLRRYKMAPVIWGVGMPMAAFVGYLRVAGDRHYGSDVLVGALMSSGIGVGLPLLLHRPKLRERARLSPFPGGAEFAWRF